MSNATSTYDLVNADKILRLRAECFIVALLKDEYFFPFKVIDDCCTYGGYSNQEYLSDHFEVDSVSVNNHNEVEICSLSKRDPDDKNFYVHAVKVTTDADNFDAFVNSRIG